MAEVEAGGPLGPAMRSANRHRGVRRFLLLAIVVSVCVAYSNVLQGPFVFDDRVFILSRGKATLVPVLPGGLAQRSGYPGIGL